MFRKFCVVLFIGSLAILEVQCKPAITSGLKSCFKQSCPENTFSCQKFSKLSDDKKEIITEIECLGLRDKVLKKTSAQEPNPFGPTVFYQGYSYTAAVKYTSNSSGNDFNDADVETNIVDVDKDISDKTSGSTKFSEADDLNSPKVV